MNTPNVEAESPIEHRVGRWISSRGRERRLKAFVGFGACLLTASTLLAGDCMPDPAGTCRGTDLGGSAYLYPHQRKIADVTLVVFDTETTGYNARRDRIVELSAVKFRDGEILETKSWLINPECPIPYRARKEHGISTTMVKYQRTFTQTYAEFEDFTEDCVLIAHNARFDIAFMNAEVSRARLVRMPNHVIDSMNLFRAWYPELKSYTVDSLVRRTGVPKGKFRRTLADSISIALIFMDGSKQMAESAKLLDIYAIVGGPFFFREPSRLPLMQHNTEARR